jgi:peptide/nickel transport system substrate-binding protein
VKRGHTTTLPRAAAAASAVALALAVTACSGGGSGGGSGTTGDSAATGDQHYASGASATILLPSDPGSLDPDLTSLSVTLQTDDFLYDSLVAFSPAGGMEPALATSWHGSSTKATFTLRKGVTCADGTPLTAATVAANLNFIANPKNASSRIGLWMPPGATAAAAGTAGGAGTVTVISKVPDAFLVSDIGQAQIVCADGLRNRSTLREGADGTGPYTLTSAVPGSSYTLTLRKGYDWGPGGVTSKTPGLPATVTLKVVSDQTTAANLLLSGGATISTVIGSDQQRLQAAGLYTRSVSAPFGEMWFNHKRGMPTADQAVRTALTESVQLSQLGQVLSGGTGTPATGLVAPAMSPCKGNTVAGNLPAYSPSAAKAALAGKNMSVTLYYPASYGSGGTAAAELLQSVWSKLGVKVTLRSITDAELDSQIVGGQVGWDVALIPVNVTAPSQLVPFLSGPTPPAGTNFSYISNTAYTADVTRAAATAGAGGCPAWNAAETALFKGVDLVPFVDSAITTYAKGATFQLSQGNILPASLRMLG